MGGNTTEIFNRRLRHWKTTFCGAAVMSLGIAGIIWPAHAAVFDQVNKFLIGSAFMAAADAQRQNIQ